MVWTGLIGLLELLQTVSTFRIFQTIRNYIISNYIENDYERWIRKYLTVRRHGPEKAERPVVEVTKEKYDQSQPTYWNIRSNFEPRDFVSLQLHQAGKWELWQSVGSGARIFDSNDKKHDIRTNYPTILHIVWIPSSKPMFTTTSFLTQMNPANFLPANNHPQFTGAPSHRAPRCTKHLSAWIARCTCAILVAKEVQKTVERDRLWEGREMNGKCVQCANSCVIAKCCGSAGAFSKLSEHWDVWRHTRTVLYRSDTWCCR